MILKDLQKSTVISCVQYGNFFLSFPYILYEHKIICKYFTYFVD